MARKMNKTEKARTQIIEAGWLCPHTWRKYPGALVAVRGKLDLVLFEDGSATTTEARSKTEIRWLSLPQADAALEAHNG